LVRRSGKRVGMSSQSPQQFDVCIVGGGPAGSIVALRLALLGHRVCLFERSTFPRRHVGESLTPGVWPILDSLNLRQLVLQGALTPRSTRILWSRPHADLLTPDQMHDWLLVDRGEFDTLLLRAAASAGVSVLQPATVRAAGRGTGGWCINAAAGDHSWPIEAAYLVDATGRAGFRRGKRELVSPRTIAVCGYLQRQFVEHDVYVEALRDCWCWGAPVPGRRFSVMVFLEADRLAAVGRERLPEFWRSQLADTELFARVSQWPLAGPLVVRDATSYFDDDPMTSSFARVGEASYALDPLSSTGVEKAAQNGTVAAIAIHTMLKQPSSTELCLRFYRDRQMETISAHRAWASTLYGSVARYAESSFWRSRSIPAGANGPPPTPGTPRASTNPTGTKFTLQAMVRVSDKVQIVEEPCIVDDEICLHAAVMHPALNRPIAFLHDIALLPLLDMARLSRDINDLLDIWSAHVQRQTAHRIVRWLLDRQILETI
jgi:flavin-dependent dehydrogenase